MNPAATHDRTWFEFRHFGGVSESSDGGCEGKPHAVGLGHSVAAVRLRPQKWGKIAESIISLIDFRSVYL